MKYSITLSSFRKLEPVDETLSRLAGQGFDAVEMYGEPEEIDMAGLKDSLSATRFCVSGITGMWGRVSRHGWKRKLLSSDRTLVEAAENYVRDCIKMCSQLGGEELNICLFADDIVGFDRTHDVISNEEKSKIIAKSLPSIRQLCRDAADNGVRLALEPLNRYSAPYCAKAADAIEIVNKVNDLGILLDTFHMNIEEDSFKDAIFSCRDLLIHTHFADNNRKVPGYAHIDFKEIVTCLQRINYSGYVSFEPNVADKDYESMTKRGLDYIRSIENALNQT